MHRQQGRDLQYINSEDNKINAEPTMDSNRVISMDTRPVAALAA